jgi:GNAT superfamily N-acetyltransferase
MRKAPKGMTVRPATSVFDALAMRRVRNTCRAFMTRDQSRISVLRQLRWWFARPPSVHAYVADYQGDTIGYGLLVEDLGRAWLTGGLIPSERSRGFGTEVFRFLAHEAGRLRLTPYLEVRASNLAGRRVYKKLGFVEIRRSGDILTMRTRPCPESTT